MAIINISVGELFERAKEFNILPGLIKSLYADNNVIVTEIDLGRFIPDLKMKVSFEAFEEGKALFKIQSPAVVKLPSKLIKRNLYEDIVLVEKGNLIIDLNRAIEKKTDKVRIKDMDFVNEIFTIKI
jgi:hypothetical protein